MSVKVLTILAFIAGCSIAGTTGTCQVRVPSDTSIRPIIIKSIGNRRIRIPNKIEVVNLYDGGQISLQCDTTFKYPSQYSGQSAIEVDCENGRIRYTYSNSVLFECDTLKWNLYETSTPFSWCPPPMESYAIAQPNGSSDYTFLAGVCYNFADMSVQSLHYVMAKKSSKYTSQFRFREYAPSTKIENVPDNFVTQDITLSNYDNPQTYNWMQFAKYNTKSLIQNTNLQDLYTQLGGLLDINWWSGLRLGNWQLYEEALSQHVEEVGYEYDILAGISGTVSAPIYERSCHKNRTLVEVADDMNQKMPLYIWHYLKSSMNEKDNVVVIGVNSPFYEFYNETEIMFCKNICSQIDWLKRVHSTFQYKTMGVIFCCSVNEVKLSKRLNGFPQPIKPTIPNWTPLSILPPSKPQYEVLDAVNQNENEYDDDIVNSNENDY